MEKKRIPESIGAVLGRNVRVRRAAGNISQEELAERCGMKRSYVGAIERAEIDVRLTTLEKLARGLRVDPYQLLIDAQDQLNIKR